MCYYKKFCNLLCNHTGMTLYSLRYKYPYMKTCNLLYSNSNIPLAQ